MLHVFQILILQRSFKQIQNKKNETDEQNTKDLDYFDDITTSSEELMSFLTLICVDVSGVRFEKSGSKITYLENLLRHFLDLLSVFLRQTIVKNKNVKVTGHVPKIRLSDLSRPAINHKNVSFFNFTSGSSFYNYFLKLWNFLLIRDRPKIWNAEIHPCYFLPISRDAGKLGIPNSVGMFLYLMLKNFYHFWVIKEKPTGVW